MSRAQPELPLKVVPGKRSDARALAAKVFERHGITLGEDDPAFALVTLNELTLRKAMSELLHEVDQHIKTGLAEFQLTMQRLEGRAGSVLAQQVRDSTGGLQGTLREEIASARLERLITPWFGQISIMQAISRGAMNGTEILAECGRGSGVVSAHEWIGPIRRQDGFSASIQTAEAEAAATPAGPFSRGAELSPRRPANGSSWTRREQCQAYFLRMLSGTSTIEAACRRTAHRPRSDNPFLPDSAPRQKRTRCPRSWTRAPARSGG